jgi:hypothetical protein
VLHPTTITGILISLPTGPNTISWNNQSATPTFVNIQLLHNNISTFQPVPNLLSADGTFATGVNLQSGMIILLPFWLVPQVHPFGHVWRNGANSSTDFGSVSRLLACLAVHLCLQALDTRYECFPKRLMEIRRLWQRQQGYVV